MKTRLTRRGSHPCFQDILSALSREHLKIEVQSGTFTNVGRSLCGDHSRADDVAGFNPRGIDNQINDGRKPI